NSPNVTNSNPSAMNNTPNRTKLMGATIIVDEASGLETSNVVIRIGNEKIIVISTINPIKTSPISVISSPNVISRTNTTNTTNRKSATSRVATKHRMISAIVIAVVVTMISATSAVSASATVTGRVTVARIMNKTTTTK